MRRRIICAILAAVLLMPIALFVPGSTSKAMKKPGRIDGVDYTRVRENKELIVDVQFTLGTTQFKGQLVNGATLSNDEIDKIIDGVMDEMDITCGILEFSKDVIEQAKHLKGFDPAVALRIGLNIAGYGTVLDVFDMYHGKKSIPDGLTGIVIDQISGEAVKLLTGKKWADVLLNAFLSTKDIAAEWTRIEKEKEIAELAMQRELLLEVFYRECNARLEKAEKERGTTQWKLKANDVQSKAKPIFGIDVTQFQRLIVDMERVNKFGYDTNTNWSGTYRGSITIEFWHNLANFDTNFPTLFTDSSSIFKKVEAIYKARPRSAKEPSTLTKRVTVTDAEFNVDRRNAVGTTLTKNISLSGAEDVSAFHLAHTVTYALDFSRWKDGSLDIEGTVANYHANATMDENCSGTLLEGNRYPAILWLDHEVDAWDMLNAPRGGWDKRALAGNGVTRIGTPALVDYQIFSDLRDNQITLWVKNVNKVVKP